MKRDSIADSPGANRTTILYLNPEPVTSKCVDTLRERGHSVVTTTKGADALALMRRQSFDALVMNFTQETVDIY